MSEVTAAAASIGQSVDAELAVVKARLAVLEADASTDWTKVKAWVSSNWPHFVTWLAVSGLSVSHVLTLVKAL